MEPSFFNCFAALRKFPGRLFLGVVAVHRILSTRILKSLALFESNCLAVTSVPVIYWSIGMVLVSMQSSDLMLIPVLLYPSIVCCSGSSLPFLGPALYQTCCGKDY